MLEDFLLQFVLSINKVNGVTGGDGLVKLWTVKTNECIATYDQHEGKVYKGCYWLD